MDLNKEKKCLLLTTYLPQPVCGGSGVLLNELFSRFSLDEVTALVGKMDQEIGVALNGNMKVYRKKGLDLPWSRVDMIRFITLLMLEAFTFQYRNKYAYVICGEYYPMSIVALALHLFYGVPYFVFFHGEDIYKIRRWRKWLLKPILSNAKGVIANSDNTKLLIQNTGSTVNVIVCKPCADYKRFQPSRDVESTKKELGLTNKKVILTVSRIIPRKGHKLAISVLQKIKRKYPDVMLVIVGQDNYGYGDKLKEHIKKCEVENNVIFRGTVSDEELIKYYQACDVFTMVSDTGPNDDDLEGFGITFLEASACEKPVICGNSGGMPEAVEDGVTGFVIDPNSENEFIEKIERLLGDQAECRRMGREGRKRILKNFDYDDRSNFLRKKLYELLSL